MFINEADIGSVNDRFYINVRSLTFNFYIILTSVHVKVKNEFLFGFYIKVYLSTQYLHRDL